MRKRSKISVVFFVLLTLSILIFIISLTGILSGPSSIFAKIFSPFQSISFSGFNFLTNSSTSKVRLEDENRILISKLADYDKLVRENQALRDQFETQVPKSTEVLPAKVVGAPSFIPGVTDPTFLIIDKGLHDHIKIGSAVVIKNILVGKVISVSDYFSKVSIVSNPDFLINAFDQRTQAQGVVKGKGGRQMILNNVLQSQEVKAGDILITKGDQREDGTGFPPDLIIGKIMSVDKKPSAVFQMGEAQSPLSFSKLSEVFVVVY